LDQKLDHGDLIEDVKETKESKKKETKTSKK